MDTSRKYIKMCDCPEIQEQWKPKEGDYFSFIGDIHILSDYEIWALGKKEPSDIDCWNKIITLMGGHFVDHWNECGNSFVWLPLQGQIQGMLGFKDLHILLNNFDYYRKQRDSWFDGHDKRWFGINSMEQLWLAFYMYEKHQLVWEGEKWIKK